jgi:maltooligosyltrehalose synthase
MSDLVGRVTGDMNALQKILSKIPGFQGYVDRTNRRSADKLLRETVANRFEEQWRRLSTIQADMIKTGGLAQMQDLERAAIKLRQFIDRIRTAAYGYAGFFDAIKINQDELNQVYQYDLAMLELVDEVGRAIDNVEVSLGTDGLPAAIHNLTTQAQKCLDVYNHRSEAMIGGVSNSTNTTPQP